MEGYNRSSHAKYRCEYHFVWVPKYRYHVLVQEIKLRLRAILTELCEWLDVTIIDDAIWFGSCAYVFIRAAKVFAIPCNENTQGEKC